MKNKVMVVVIIALVAGGIGVYLWVGQSKTPGVGGRTDAQIADRLGTFLAEQAVDGFAGVVLVVKGDDILLRKGYGLADREAGIPFSDDTVFTVGSISKQFTGAAIMKLVVQGRLSVDDTLDQFFADVPDDKRSIKIHHLLTHTAGMPDALGDDFDTKATRDWLVGQAMNVTLPTEPGDTHRYSNTGYGLLAAIVEIVSGQGYEAYMREHLFLPAGMSKTGYILPGFDPPDFAVGYRGDERWGTILERPMLDDGPTWNLRGGGGIHTTIGDMLKWHMALKGNDILSEEAKATYFAPHVDEGYGDSYYGYGWVNWTTEWGTRLLSHNGGNGYFSADCHRYVEDDVLIFIAANGDFKAWDLMDRLETITFDCE